MSVTVDEADLVARLRAAGCVFAEDEAAVLLEAAVDEQHLDTLTARRVGGEPLEYVVGYADFCGVRVQLEAGVFIPRQRTAHLVRTAAQLAPARAVCLDLCCGSGALGLAFGHLVPDAAVHAADIDPVAVRCARRNLADVHESDLFESVPAELRGGIDIVLANVPYVPTGELDHMPVEAREHEPVATHDGGLDGLDVLRRVLAEAPLWLAPHGRVLTEISDRQRDAATRVIVDAGFSARLLAHDDTIVAVAS